MNAYLSCDHFPQADDGLESQLKTLLETDFSASFYPALGKYQQILADNRQKDQWPDIHNRLSTLFKCGTPVVMDGPMIGIPLGIRDSDYFQDTVRELGRQRSQIASIEWLASIWNLTFADTGLWMGKSFEAVTRETLAKKCAGHQETLDAYSPQTCRIGRNFFREPPGPGLMQEISIPVLNRLWNLKDRPLSPDAQGFDGVLTREHLDKEKNIPYSKTGGIYIGNFGRSVLKEMNSKKVYQLNYRWPELNPVYPMTRLVDELVQIEEGIYLGQLIYATRHYSLGSLRLPFCPDLPDIPIGEPYAPGQTSVFDFFRKWFSQYEEYQDDDDKYGYQNNGYFLMMDPAFAKEVYSDGAFPQLRPRSGESGFAEMGYDQPSGGTPAARDSAQTPWPNVDDWTTDWKKNSGLNKKFTSFILEGSPKKSDTDIVQDWLQDDESILQMLQRISTQISGQSNWDDRLIYFEKLNQLFRQGVAPGVEKGIFKGHGEKGYNVQAEGSKKFDFYGQAEAAKGFDYYHGATLNLHLGFRETLSIDPDASFDQSLIFPSSLASTFGESPAGPNVLNLIWHSIGKYIFPWAGKSYEKISGRKLSMYLDESQDLAERYPERVHEIKSHLASAPHYSLVQKNARNYWTKDGPYAAHLKSGSWDKGMTDEDKAFWEKEAKDHWVDGNNTQDERIVPWDPLMRAIDMNFRVPDPALQALSQEGPSPFSRQGYKFLGRSGQESILPMNNGENKKKTVFQFHYRTPMLGGPMPIGLCLDEIVEIADGLYLGQLIYSTALDVPFHTSIDTSEFKYQLFGYFLLLDNAWQHHRLAIGLDTWK